MQEILGGVWGLFFSAFISSTIAPGGSEAVLAYMVSEGHYEVQQLVIVACYWQHARCYDNMGVRDVSGEKIPCHLPFAREKAESSGHSKKKRYLGLVFFMVASHRRCFMFCRRMAKTPFIASLFSYFFRKIWQICCDSMDVYMKLGNRSGQC